MIEEVDVTDKSRFLSAAVRGLPVFSGVLTADALPTGTSAGEVALLHLNESPFPPSPRVVEAVARSAGQINRYGSSHPERLAKRLAERTGILPSRIVIGNGSDEILAFVCQMCLTSGDSAVMPTPSFPRYRLSTRLMGAEPRLVRNLADGRNDVAGLIKAIDHTTRVVFACTPNNPSGAPLEQAELAELARAVPEDVLLVVDEAYAEFHAYEGGKDALGALAARNGPWLSTRTLSKAYSLAGMRVGYGLAGSEAVAEGLLRVKLNFNLGILAIYAAEAALDDESYAQASIGKVVAERRRLADAIDRMGFKTLPSRANFISFDYGSDAAPVRAAMARDGVFVREWRDVGFETFIRISIGLPAENDRALHSFGKAVELLGDKRSTS